MKQIRICFYYIFKTGMTLFTFRSSGLSNLMVCMVNLRLSLTGWITMTPQTNQSLSWAPTHSFCFSDISPSVKSHLFIFHCPSPDSLTFFLQENISPLLCIKGFDHLLDLSFICLPTQQTIFLSFNQSNSFCSHRKIVAFTVKLRKPLLVGCGASGCRLLTGCTGRVPRGHLGPSTSIDLSWMIRLLRLYIKPNKQNHTEWAYWM